MAAVDHAGALHVVLGALMGAYCLGVVFFAVAVARQIRQGRLFSVLCGIHFALLLGVVLRLTQLTIVLVRVHNCEALDGLSLQRREWLGFALDLAVPTAFNLAGILVLMLLARLADPKALGAAAASSASISRSQHVGVAVFQIGVCVVLSLGLAALWDAPIRLSSSTLRALVLFEAAQCALVFLAFVATSLTLWARVLRYLESSSVQLRFAVISGGVSLMFASRSAGAFVVGLRVASDVPLAPVSFDCASTNLGWSPFAVLGFLGGLEVLAPVAIITTLLCTHGPRASTTPSAAAAAQHKQRLLPGYGTLARKPMV
eukprot:a846247_16.p1 GENE.a846247_16~~a846247_16.p1  ORF type:complete len:330 (-),score=88.27 a846247_16:211-1158(-)